MLFAHPSLFLPFPLAPKRVPPPSHGGQKTFCVPSQGKGKPFPFIPSSPPHPPRPHPTGRQSLPPHPQKRKDESKTIPTRERGVKLHSVRDSAKKEPLPTLRVCRNVPRKSSPPPPVSSIKLKGKIENVVAKSSSQRRVFGSFTVSADHLLVICKLFPHQLAIKISWRFRVKTLPTFNRPKRSGDFLTIERKREGGRK